MAENVVQDGEFKPIALFQGVVEKESVLARYAESRAIRIVASRLIITDKGEHGLTETEALLIGQAALSTGLSPFQPQPELWYWIRKKDGKRHLTLMRGRDGTEMLAERAAKNAGNRLEPPRYREIIDKPERARLGIPEGALASEARIENYLDNRSYYQRRSQLKDEGMSSEEIDERLGKLPPAHYGIGVLRADEMKKFDQGYGAKMPHINRVRKRAKTEAQKPWAARLDLMALQKDRSPDLDDYIVEGEWMDVEVLDEGSAEEMAAKAKKGAATLYGLECPACHGALQDPPPMDCPHCGVQGIGHKLAAEKPAVTSPAESTNENRREFSEKLLNKIVEKGLAPDIEEALAGLERSPWISKDVPLRSHTNVLDWYQVYMAEKDRGARSDKAARIATEGAKGIT